MDTKSNQSVNSVDLRYMQVEVSLEDGALLPGVDTIESFRMCEYISLIERTPQGLICYLRLEYDHPQVLKMKVGGFEILEIKSQNKHTALVKAFASGPLTRIFCKDEEAWWVNPTKLSSTSIHLTSKLLMSRT